MNNIAVIPARGGSKRIERKNIRLFVGKPMIWYAINAARTSGLFKQIIVSTDDEEIADIAGRCGAEIPFMRPKELADDYTPTVPVIAHAIKALEAIGSKCEGVCCIYPCVPFISVEDILNAYEVFKQTNSKYVFPVTAYPSPIQRALCRKEDGSIAPFYPEYKATRTQDLESGYFDVGQFYWGTRDVWLYGSDIHSNATTIVIPEWRVVDIDTPADFERAELIYKTISEIGKK